MLHGHQFLQPVRAQYPTSAPLERAGMVYAPLDITVVDGSTGLPLGRPWIAACIDEYTRCVLGIDISFEAPGHLTLARCVEDALRPKAALNEMYPGIANTWDAHGVMRELVVDNSAEFNSKSVRNKCHSLGINLHFATSKNPCFKSPTEHLLGALNAAIANGYPVTGSKSVSETKVTRGPLSSHAVIDHGKLHEIICRWIVDVYHQTPHRALNAAPATVWRSSINQAEIPLPDDPALLGSILGRSEDQSGECSPSRRFPGAYLLDADPHVVAFHEQPLTIRYVLDGEVHPHYPDMVVHFAGSRELWEIKPASEAADPVNADRTKRLSAALPEPGFAYRLIIAEDLARQPRLSNVLTLLKCSLSRRFPGAYLTTWIRAIQRASFFRLFRPR